MSVLVSEKPLAIESNAGAAASPIPVVELTEVQADGPPEQQYGYSARSVMAIYKYFAGSPFYRQQTLQGLLGGHLAASTILWSKRQGVVNTISPSLLPEPDRHLSAHPALPSNTAYCHHNFIEV